MTLDWMTQLNTVEQVKRAWLNTFDYNMCRVGGEREGTSMPCHKIVTHFLSQLVFVGWYFTAFWWLINKSPDNAKLKTHSFTTEKTNKTFFWFFKFLFSCYFGFYLCCSLAENDTRFFTSLNDYTISFIGWSESGLNLTMKNILFLWCTLRAIRKIFNLLSSSELGSSLKTVDRVNIRAERAEERDVFELQINSLQ